MGARLAGRVTEAADRVRNGGLVTLVHGDASVQNMRTGPDGEVVLLDWEDVSAAPGVLDVAWLLVSSTDPARWDEVIKAYGPAGPIAEVLPAVIVQGLLSLSNTPPRSADAVGWIFRLAAAADRLGSAW